MRILRNLFLGLVLVVSGLLGCVVLGWTMESKAVAEKTQPQPVKLSLLQLMQAGVPDNLYVGFTDFRLGEPVIEKGEQGWSGAWLPLEPTTPAEDDLPFTVFYHAEVSTQAELDAFVKAPPHEALVTNGLAKSSGLQLAVSPTLRKAYPNLISTRVLLLAPPRCSFFGGVVPVSDPRLRDPQYENLGAWTGGGLLLFAFFCLYRLIRGGRGKQATHIADDPKTEARRAQLATERPESVHETRPWGVLQMTVGFVLLSALLLLIAGLFSAGLIANQRDGKPITAVIFMLMNVPVLLGLRASLRAVRRTLRFPADITLCASGLRWHERGKQREILWSEVAEARRDVRYIQRYQPGGLVGAYRQLNNPQPPIVIDTVLIRLHSGESYRFSGKLVTEYIRLAETAPRLWKESVMGRGMDSVTDAWLRAMPNRTRSTRVP